MKTKIHRVSIIVIAVLLGIVLVLCLSLLGTKGSGPVDHLLSGIGRGVSNMENKFILNKREHTRSQSLKWFKGIKSDKLKIGRTDKILYGAYDDQVSETYQSVVDLEDSLHTVFPIISLYSAWGSKPEEQFPSSRVQAITDIGSIPLITWEPWVADFSQDDYPNIPPKDKRDKFELQAIAAGTYDAYIDKWAGDAKEIQSLMFIRFGHEMNDPYRYPWGPQNNKPEDFIAAWRHVVSRFKQDGVKNVIWVWSPHPAYKNYDAYYPGDKYVDWVGAGTLNYGTVASWSQWYTFDEIFGKYYAQFAKYKKPIMISEFGSLATGGDREKWYKDALAEMPVKYPLVKSVVFFHVANDNTTTDKALNWYIKDDHQITHTIADIINKK
ncbi:MAG TPA: glycosyl hydrolase [Mucilaginibacter sp.]